MSIEAYRFPPDINQASARGYEKSSGLLYRETRKQDRLDWICDGYKEVLQLR
jgi:hypothetical protein